MSGSSSARWVGANAIGQATGLAVTGLLGHLSGSFGEPPVALVIAGILGAGLLEGAILGAAQAWTLGTDVPRGRWVALTTLAFGVWWTGGALASLFEPPAPSRRTVVLVALVAGGALGVLVGVLQGRLLPARRAAWLGANAAGWSAGLLVAALAAELVPWGPFGGMTLVVGALGGAATGAVVGLVTAPWRPSPEER